jgi:hypothetical protein
MGTRGNIRVHDGNPDRGVLLYSHWDADTVLPEAVKSGLTRGKGRWDDFPYLTRIIFCDLIRDDLDGTTGYGLASSLKDVDGNDRVLDVDCRRQQITFTGEFGKYTGETLSFEAFTAAPKADIR